MKRMARRNARHKVCLAWEPVRRRQAFKARQLKKKKRKSRSGVSGNLAASPTGTAGTPCEENREGRRVGVPGPAPPTMDDLPDDVKRMLGNFALVTRIEGYARGF